MPKRSLNYINILSRCIEIAKDRQAQYGKATKSITDAVDILKTVFNITLTEREFCNVLIALKLSRLKYKFKADSMQDIINYIAIGLACESKSK